MKERNKYMTPFVEINFINQYDGEYIHKVFMFGVEYSQSTFCDDDWYKAVTIGLIFIKITLGLR